MPQPIQRFPKPKMMNLKWGRGRTKVLVYGKYRRGNKWSYATKALDKKRKAHKSVKQHRKYPHTVDLPKRKW